MTNKSLSELVALRELVQNISAENARILSELPVVTALTTIKSITHNFVKQQSINVRQIENIVDNLNNKFQLTIDQVLNDLDSKIENESLKYINLWDDRVLLNASFFRACCQLTLTSEIESILLGRIQKYSDWHYPGLMLGLGNSEYAQHLVANDPLYLVDYRPEFIAEVLDTFTPEYQARVRPYSPGKQLTGKGLSKLPSNQLGFIFSWNTVNYLPPQEVQKLLLEAHRILRPGGIFLFSFNDASTFMGAKNIEDGNTAYTTKKKIVESAINNGFEFVASFNFEHNFKDISWVEIKKPGNLTTIKAHQTLGAIKQIEQ